MSVGARLGILGGTLDPVHVGHLETARAARAALGLDRILLLPSRVPPHRAVQPAASPFHRFAMTALAVNGVDGLEASDAELTAPGTSYTADTLERFHASGLAASQIFFILGADAFAEIETWNRYPQVIDLANFVVVSRPGYDTAQLTDRLPALSSRFTSHREAVAIASAHTRIYLVSAATPDVSSTDIRRRLRASAPVAGLVSDAVDRHIRQHALYQDHSSSTRL
ncbi:MAG: nicotinate-nucleotide adenylyltransferase [Vicinamibacterales bacterium]